MQPTLRIINCPCCNRVLYTLASEKSRGKDTWRLTQDSPMIKKDPQGVFMMCARCGKRIALVMADELESPGFELAAHQDCGDDTSFPRGKA